MNLRLNPKIVLVAMGSDFPLVKSWKAVFIAFRK